MNKYKKLLSAFADWVQSFLSVVTNNRNTLGSSTPSYKLIEKTMKWLDMTALETAQQEFKMRITTVKTEIKRNRNISTDETTHTTQENHFNLEKFKQKLRMTILHLHNFY